MAGSSMMGRSGTGAGRGARGVRRAARSGAGAEPACTGHAPGPSRRRRQVEVLNVSEDTHNSSYRGNNFVLRRELVVATCGIELHVMAPAQVVP